MNARLRLPVLLLAATALAAPGAAHAATGPLLSLTPEQLQAGRATLAQTTWRVRVVAQPWVEGQVATVRFYRNGTRVDKRDVALAMSPTGRSGMAVVPFTSGRPGRVTVQATHPATPGLPTLTARPVRVRVLALSAAPGARGPVVRMLQRRLAGVGYVVGRRGFYDARTARAVLAFRKVAGMARTSIASGDVFRRLLAGGGRFRVRHPEHGRHVEADLSRQVLALIRGGSVERIYPFSSGKPSTPTVRGSFRVYSKTPGTNHKGMVFSSYFIGGYAIHGYYSVPVFAASHGCLRVPIPDAVPIYKWLSFGDIVDVYP
ncbi:MAG: L,D-transpeptidase family protein [Actinomycetota bacterium]|nr:L,D-transpeptidase family protein [Actinomycetota bacterium]